MTANFHTHTMRCNHASGEDREYVEAAIKAGIKVLGFADHTPYVGFDGDYYTYFRMRPELLSDYTESVNSLKKEYKDDIEIYLGLETEYYPELFPEYLEFIKPYGIEYLLFSQHFCDTDQYGTYAARITDKNEGKRYCDQCIEAMETGLFSCAAHPDLFGFPRDSEEFVDYCRRFCRAAKAADMPLEINLQGLSLGRHYPCREFFAVAAEIGNEVILGRDAHSPDAFFDKETEEKALDMARELGLNITEKIDAQRFLKRISAKK